MHHRVQLLDPFPTAGVLLEKQARMWLTAAHHPARALRPAQRLAREAEPLASASHQLLGDVQL